MTNKTKKCRECGGVFTYDLLIGNRNSASGVRNVCKGCATIVKNKAAKAQREEQKRLAEIERLRRLNDPATAKPRTFSHLKDKATWDGWTERQYIRNDGNKHIQSKGV